ncbi:hypothetical protein Tco_0878100 [Tanacetum coccineum]|uniref:Uncharacterized protein n=1 Tax=Tanacetum coccineum TaxID=301880 RepID=A0ABQ5C2A8_9ASTR
MGNLHANDMLKELKTYVCSASRAGASPDYAIFSLLQAGRRALHDQTLNLPKNNAPALHAIRVGKVQKAQITPATKREESSKGLRSVMRLADERTLKEDYPHVLAELLKKKKIRSLWRCSGSGFFAYGTSLLAFIDSWNL